MCVYIKNLTLKQTKRENGIVKITTIHDNITRIFPHVVASDCVLLSSAATYNHNTWLVNVKEDNKYANKMNDSKI